MDDERQDSCPNIEVLTLGLPRCANGSLASALSSDVFGYRPILRPSNTVMTDWDAYLLKALSNSGDKDLPKRQESLCKMLRDNTACAETLNALANDLLDRCPRAKLILNVRPPSTEGEDVGVVWARSCRATIIFYATMRFFWFCAGTAPYSIWHYRYRKSTKIWRQKGLVPLSQSKLIEFNTGRAWMTPDFYHNYIAWIRDEAHQRNREVLIWHAEEGWAPLCEFLGKPLPSQDVPFPHLNDRAMWEEDRRRFIRDSRNRILISFVICVIFAFVRTWLLGK